MCLLGTDVVSELRKQKPHKGVLAWIQDIPEESLFLSAVSIGESQAGIEITRDQDERKAKEIEEWLDRVAQSYNVVAVDAPTHGSPYRRRTDRGNCVSPWPDGRDSECTRLCTLRCFPDQSIHCLTTLLTGSWPSSRDWAIRSRCRCR